MNKKIQKIIIWFFEKYAYDYWIDLQIDKENKELLKKYQTKDLKEAFLLEADRQNEPNFEAYEEAYNAGVEEGLKSC